MCITATPRSAVIFFFKPYPLSFTSFSLSSYIFYEFPVSCSYSSVHTENKFIHRVTTFDRFTIDSFTKSNHLNQTPDQISSTS